MDYIRLHFTLSDNDHDTIIAELFEVGFEGFEQEENKLIASIPAEKFVQNVELFVEQLLSTFEGAQILNKELIKPQNWNEKWESSIEPQTIGTFYVRPTWGKELDSDSELKELLIDPKMAFGTGYHATTRLILSWLDEIVEEKDHVLDAGTGTGILGIAALKLGAKLVFGFDIDEWSEDNCHENITLNNVDGFDVKLGSTEVIPSGSIFDLILANINRNALIELIPELLSYLRNDGTLLLSGLLEDDEQTILNLDSVKSLKHLETRQNGEWIAILLKK
ncbi:MAG TPA: 50S ribosomal protein L11 methyltransferase [Balneola sp.]|jgi:ribosomal protein L11 methyltransferase|nr:50S ribosomal protein L11 methyltransferase [Balneola sp.]MAO78134.1 50S ribosomal protein L11 methyltransferase [Balneola sp.]MBF64135.1 50S ribosomal protein L11 methyltransferase [Balneola sp.]HAH50229.1 50S ribosomal protein L11 methyltransferase [Balneola sp.]HAW80085.1 50S ribosomal protein L11 methyltransferase [Balneola sp.]|tara:strand:- start:7535 stop:8368 length:834 start_codon:yes stop_codon:yes gene_type:complete